MVQRRNPRLTKTFDTEAEARDFARAKLDSGLIVTAGTLTPSPAEKDNSIAGDSGLAQSLASAGADRTRVSNEDRLV